MVEENGIHVFEPRGYRQISLVLGTCVNKPRIVSHSSMYLRFENAHDQTDDLCEEKGRGGEALFESFDGRDELHMK